MEKSNFDQLLERYLNDQLSEEEKNKIEAWLDSRKTKLDRNMSWNKEDEEQLFRKITSKAFDFEESGAAHETIGIRRPNTMRRTTWLAIAAGIIALAVASYGVWLTQTSKTDPNTFTTLDVARKVILSDGSIVWLKPSSKLTYFKSKRDGRRFAALVGEGLFEIAKDPAHPFAIRCGDIVATVVGTSFTISASDDKFELNVLTGKVNLSAAPGSPAIEVLPLERVRYPLHGKFEKSAIFKNESTPLFAGTEYDMDFQNVTMEKVFDKIARKFSVQVALTEPTVNKCRITADFTDQSLENTFQMLSEVLDVSYHISGSLVSVSGKGCH